MASPAILCLCFFLFISVFFFSSSTHSRFWLPPWSLSVRRDLAGAAEEVPHSLACVPRQPAEQTWIKISVAGAPSPTHSLALRGDNRDGSLLEHGSFHYCKSFHQKLLFFMQTPLCWLLLQRLQQAGAQDGSRNVLGSARKRYLRSKPASAGAAGVSDPTLSTKVSRKTREASGATCA